MEFLDFAYNDLAEFDFASFDQVGTLSSFKVNASHNEIPKLWINSTTFTPPTTSKSIVEIFWPRLETDLSNPAKGKSIRPGHKSADATSNFSASVLRNVASLNSFFHKTKPDRTISEIGYLISEIRWNTNNDRWVVKSLKYLLILLNI